MSMEIRSDLLVSQCAVMRKKSNKVLINLNKCIDRNVLGSDISSEQRTDPI